MFAQNSPFVRNITRGNHAHSLLVTLFLLGVAATGWAAQTGKPVYDEKAVANFYRGKTVRIIVGFSAGGGYDQYSRLIGRHLSKYIPGNPAVIVDNMAGAGSIIAANHMYNAAPKDGTVIGNISGPIILEQLFGNSAVQFDMGKFRYLAVPVSETYVFIVTRKPGVAKFEEILGPNGKEVTVGGIPGSTVEHAPVLMRDVLGANLKVVLGYKGTADVRMAIDSGEVEGFFNSYTSVKITSFDKIKSGEWLVLAQLSEKPIKDLIVPNVPTIPQFAKSTEHRLLLKYATSAPNDFGKVTSCRRARQRTEPLRSKLPLKELSLIRNCKRTQLKANSKSIRSSETTSTSSSWSF